MPVSRLRYLSDTNIFIHYVRQNPLSQFVEQTYAIQSGVAPPIISSVIVGEIRAFARLRKWGGEKRQRTQTLIERCIIAPIETEEIYEAYAELNAYSISVGRTMGNNDLWIAATALVTDAVLLTTDKDFDHLYPSQIQRIYIDPNTP